MRKVLLIASIVAALSSGHAIAQTFNEQKQTGAVAVAPDGVTYGAGAIGVSSPGQPVIVQTPAAPAYTFDAGTFVASLVNWIWLVFGGAIVTGATALFIRGMKLLGIKTSAEQNSRLEEAIRNGLNLAVARIGQVAPGKMPIEIRDKVIADAVAYVQRHQADTIRALGLNPDGGEVAEALRAKAESVILDLNQPTHPSLTPLPASDPNAVSPLTSKGA